MTEPDVDDERFLAATTSSGFLAGRRARRATKQLAEALRSSPSSGAADRLVQIIEGDHPGARVARKALAQTASIPEGAEVLAGSWTEDRRVELLEALRSAKPDLEFARWPALSFALGTAPVDPVRIDASDLPAVVQAATDPDEQVSEPSRDLLFAMATAPGDTGGRGREGLIRLAKAPRGAQVVVDRWVIQRSPDLLEILREAHATINPSVPRNVPVLLELGQLPKDLSGFDADHAIQLIDAARGNGPTAVVAERVLSETKRQSVVDAVGAVWVARPEDLLDRVIRANRTLPSGSDAALLVSVAQRRPDGVDGGGTAAVDQLLGLVGDPGFALGDEARFVLAELRSQMCQEHICELALTGDATAREAAIAGRYLPTGDPQRAAFLLFTEQWERYGEFDFDGRLIATYYAGASGEMQARLRDLIRRSGQTHVLRMLLGGNRRDRVREITRPEADYLAENLIAQGQFEEAWKLVFELPFEWGLALAERLRDAGWEPERPDDRALHRQLVQAHGRHDHADVNALASTLPLAIRRADTYIRGGVNSLAFAPDAMELAIGTNARHVGLWDLQHARLLWHRVVERSVGHVIHDGQAVFAAERTNNTTNRCAAYAIRRSGTRELGHHYGSINGLGVLPSGRVMTAGRDGFLRFWANGGSPDIKITSPIAEDWPRAIAVSEGGDRVASVHRGVNLIDIDDARLVGTLDFSSAASAAAFAPGGDDLVVGMHNGAIQICRVGGGQIRRSDRLEQHVGKVVTVASVPGRNLLITAATDGVMRAYAWPSGNLVGEIAVGVLKSVTVSPRGEWLAMGHEDVTSLWDFRVADIPGLFALPLVDTTPSHLGLLESAVAGLSGSSRRPCLDTMTAMLRYRFRHDIEIDDSATAIRAGRFDIELG